jgi:hypothetical protein
MPPSHPDKHINPMGNLMQISVAESFNMQRNKPNRNKLKPPLSTIPVINCRIHINFPPA